MSDAYYTLHIAGLERQLKRFPVSDSMDIAAFIFFGDVELTKACAEELLKKVPEFDYIVTPEAKSIPLAYEMSRQSGKKYIVARKGVKVYMDRPEKVTVHSITTQKEQTLYLGHGAAATGGSVRFKYRGQRRALGCGRRCRSERHYLPGKITFVLQIIEQRWSFGRHSNVVR